MSWAISFNGTAVNGNAALQKQLAVIAIAPGEKALHDKAVELASVYIDAQPLGIALNVQAMGSAHTEGDRIGQSVSVVVQPAVPSDHLAMPYYVSFIIAAEKAADYLKEYTKAWAAEPLRNAALALVYEAIAAQPAGSRVTVALSGSAAQGPNSASHTLHLGVSVVI